MELAIKWERWFTSAFLSLLAVGNLKRTDMPEFLMREQFLPRKCTGVCGR